MSAQLVAAVRRPEDVPGRLGVAALKPLYATYAIR